MTIANSSYIVVVVYIHPRPVSRRRRVVVAGARRVGGAGVARAHSARGARAGARLALLPPRGRPRAAHARLLSDKVGLRLYLYLSFYAEPNAALCYFHVMKVQN